MIYKKKSYANSTMGSTARQISADFLRVFMARNVVSVIKKVKNFRDGVWST